MDSDAELDRWLAVVDGRDVLDLDDLIERPRWMRDALCREHPETEFFVEVGQKTQPAKDVCVGCLVRAECLAYALEEGIAWGVWGGLSRQERSRLRHVHQGGQQADAA